MAQPELAETSAPFLDDQVLFPEEPHAWYRIPSIVVANSGVVLAFAERRIGTNHDWGYYGEGLVNGTHGGLTRYDDERLLLTIATQPGRNEQSILVSSDDGKTWPLQKVIDPGPASYSDVVVAADGHILVMYEAGHPDRKVTSGTQPGGWPIGYRWRASTWPGSNRSRRSRSWVVGRGACVFRSRCFS